VDNRKMCFGWGKDFTEDDYMYHIFVRHPLGHIR